MFIVCAFLLDTIHGEIKIIITLRLEGMMKIVVVISEAVAP